jgi:hypothetical protein
MTTLNKKVFQKLTGKKLEDLHAPTLQDVRNRVDQQLSSPNPIRSLGLAQDGERWFTEESRESHIHILGTTGEGKSKFLEHIIRQDIDLGYGVCLIDGSENGDTCYNVLKYCAKNKIEKVCLIDPHHRYSKKVEVSGQEVGCVVLFGLMERTLAVPFLLSRSLFKACEAQLGKHRAERNAANILIFVH